MQLSHDCMQVLCVPRESNFLHDFNCLLEEWISHGAEIEPLHVPQAGLTKWMGKLPGL